VKFNNQNRVGVINNNSVSKDKIEKKTNTKDIKDNIISNETYKISDERSKSVN